MMRLSKFWLVMTIMCMSLAAVGCGGEDEDPTNPNNKVPDPEGTIPISMRNQNNGSTHIEDKLYIDKGDNFTGASVVSMGSMKGLGNIVTAPANGWADKVSVKPECGYVAQIAGGLYMRLFVEDYIVGTNGGIIGAEVKYQYPFIPKNCLVVDQYLIMLPSNGGSQVVKIINYVPYTVEFTDSYFSLSEHDPKATEITVNASSNDSRKNKSCDLLFRDENGHMQRVLVFQYGW